MRKELTVGEVARRSGIAVSALHFYEARGLIASHRTSGNQRRYGRDVLRRIAIIRVAQDVGIPLAEIAAALAALPEGRTPTRHDWRILSEGWAVQLDRRIAQLKKLRTGLAGCIGCGCMSIDRCPLYNPEDRLGRQGTGARRLAIDARKATHGKPS